MRRLSGWAFLVGMGAVFGSSLAETAEPTIREKVFVREVLSNNRAERKYAELAEKQGSVKVKAFAARLLVANKRFGEKLESIARDMNVRVPAELNRDQQGTIDGLSKLSGAEFDRAFLTRIVQDRERGVKAFEDEAAKGGSEELKKLCRDALPHMERQLKRARDLADELKEK